MGSSVFKIFFFVVLIVLCEAKVGFAQSNANAKNYITWNDLRIDDRDKLRRGDANVIVVDKGGRGDSLTVQGAVNMVPQNNTQRFEIHILPGIYRERFFIPGHKPYISLIGSENRTSETRITWHSKAGDKNPKGHGYLGTQNSATVSVKSDYFLCIVDHVSAVKAGEFMDQAVAFRISGERAMFYQVRFLGQQDTLLDGRGSHYFYQCMIQGSTDFICGNAKSLYQECYINLVSDGFAIAAHHRDSAAQDSGFSFVNCTVRGGGNDVYLGRAWGDYARIIYSYTKLDVRATPRGWDEMGVPSRSKNAVFGEYKCKGRGADRSGRATYSKELSYTEARPFLDTTFINGNEWLRL